MSQTTGKSQNALFIYTKDDTGRFWVFDGSQYHHFYVDGAKFWYVRSQAFLPAFSSGRGYPMMNAERLALQAAANQHQIIIPFFETVKECEDYALLAQHEQFIFDRTFPGGFFYQKKDMRQRNDEEQGG